jgi:rRNA maturation endonuclease Nob1
MKMSNFTVDDPNEAITFCPCCGGNNYEDNRIDESLYLAAAREAPRLRFDSNEDDARAVLIALYAVQIENFIRHPWRCNACGVTFDG